MKKLITAIMLLVATSAASAQMTDHNNNLQLYLGGGVHSMLYNPADGNFHLGFGGMAGIQYQYMFNHYWGLGLGFKQAASKVLPTTVIPSWKKALASLVQHTAAM